MSAKSDRPSDPPDDDPAHVFMHLYDRLPRDAFLTLAPLQWRADREQKDIVDSIERYVVKTGRARYWELAAKVARDDWSIERQRFALLLGLDAALASANPFYGGHDQGRLTKLAVRYART